ncbi:MAG: hypothetical protein JXJ17_14110 [Anaerolineae bacterium]|nr:hypothetical protein [Anaerolineae bacterium]
MTNSESSLKKKVVTVRMTHALYANVKRLAGDQRYIGDVIREAIRQYIDDRGEITGSRRYFTGRFRDEVRMLRRDLSWHLSLITIMLAEMFSVIIFHSLDLDEATAKTFSASNILKIAEERLVESGWRVQTRVNAAIDDAELEGQRRMDSQPPPDMVN